MVSSYGEWLLKAIKNPGHGDHSKDLNESSGPLLRTFSVLGTGTHFGMSFSQNIPILQMSKWRFREVE